MSSEARISASSLMVRFGGVLAVADVGFDLAADRLLAVVGPNGSGKSTVLNAICGVVAASGSLAVDGEMVPLGTPRASAAVGIVRLFQAPQPFRGLTVHENVVIGERTERSRGVVGALVRRRSMMAAERRRWGTADDALELVGLASYRDAPVESLSYGQLRLVDLARAITAKPSVLLLDEPTAGLNDAESDHFVEILGAVRERFRPAVVLVDHKIAIVDALADSVLVIDRGLVVTEGPPAEIWADPRVQEAYLGAVSADGAP